MGRQVLPSAVPAGGLPRSLGPFLLVRHLASGGMGDVYLAHHRHGATSRLCVVKTVLAEAKHHPGLMGRFLDEARTSVLLSHDNVVKVIDVGEADGTAWIAVEHIAGRDLQGVMNRVGAREERVPPGIALFILSELLEALAYVHRAKDPRTGAPLHIVHRDISPHNVMVGFDGGVKLIDFGIARSDVKEEHTKTGQTLGKVRYMAPEQARGEDVTGAADVWAACVVGSELLTQLRFYAPNVKNEHLWLQVSGTEPLLPRGFETLSTSLQAALAPALARPPSERPSARIMTSAIGAIMARYDDANCAGLQRWLGALFVDEQVAEAEARASLLEHPTSLQAAALVSITHHDEGFGLKPLAEPTKQSLAWSDDDEPVGPIPDQHDDRDDDQHNDDVRTAATPVIGRTVAAAATRTMQAADLVDRVAAVDERNGPPSRRPPVPVLAPHDAPTAMAVLPAVPAVVPPRTRTSSSASSSAVSSSRQSVTSSSRRQVARQRRRRRQSLLLAGGLGILVLGIALGIGLAPTTTPTPLPTPTATLPTPTATLPTPTPATLPMLPPVSTPTPEPLPPAVEEVTPLPSPVRPVRGERRKPTTTTPTPTTTPTVVRERPVLLGDRLRALGGCRPTPACASGVLQTAKTVADMSADALRSFDADVDDCLDRCP
jgi:hypothetical protein